MKKSLILAAFGLVGLYAAAAVNIGDVEAGKGYLLKHVTTGLYLNTEILNGTLPTAQETGSLFFFTGTGTDNQYFIATGTADSQKWMVRDSSGDANKWNAIMSDTKGDDQYWIVEQGAGDNSAYVAIRNKYWYDSNQKNRGWGWSGNAQGTQGVVGTSLQSNRPTNNSHATVYWEIEDPDRVTSMTVTYKYNGQVISTEVITGEIGSTYTTTTPTFFADAPQSGVLSRDVTTLDVELSNVSVPFQYTANTDNLIWQAVQPRTDQVIRKWSYNPENPDCVVIKQINNNNAEGFSDNELWAIVGDIINGFEIYNKAAGLDKPLNFQGGDGFAKLSEATENTRWHIAPGNVANSVVFYISTKPGYYLNYNASNQRMQWHDKADVGSSCYFVAPATPLLAYSADCNNTVGNFVGSYTEECGLTAARQAANANLYDVEAANALRQAIAKHAAHETIEFDANKWYRFKNYSSGGYMVTAKDDNYEIWGNESSPLTNHNSIMKFMETDTDGVYTIMSQGKYFGQLGALEVQLRQSDTEEWAGKYTIDNYDAGQTLFVLRDTETQNYHTAAGYTDRLIDCIHGDSHSNRIIPQLSDWGPSAWYLEIADEVEVSLPVQEGEDYYGLGYFPFPVRALGDDVTLNYLIPCKTQDNKLALGYNTVSSVGANTSFLIMAKSDRVKLTIDYEGMSAQGIEENVLRGNYRAATAEAGDFVFTVNASGEPVFEKQNAAPSVAGNTGYVPASILPSEHVNALELPVVNAEVALGIAEIGVDAVSGEIFDLQGRRLAVPTKGINIIGGKKVLIK